MKVLPFRNLEIVDVPIPEVKIMLKEIRDWAGGNLLKYSYAFLFSADSPSAEEHFTVPIGFVHNNKLVTTMLVLKTVADVVNRFNGSEDIVSDAKIHVGRYFSKKGLVAPWGSRLYDTLIAKGRTPRVLEGPHIGGSLRPNQRRYVVFDDDRNIVFGPRI